MSRCCGGFTAGVVPGAGAYLLCCLPTLPLVYFAAPIPLPLRGRGSPKVYFAGGFAPGTPALNRLRHLQLLPYRHTTEAYLLCCLLTLPLVFDFAPYPPSPLPRRGRGRLKVYFAGGFAPRHPCAEPLAALTAPAIQVHGAGTCLLCCPPTMPLVYFAAPIPPAPFPGGEGGAPKFISPGASPPAPLH